MSWLEQLVQTYEESEEIVGKFGLDGMKSVLPPVGHILGDAQIEIVLNGEGELISVEVLPKEKQQTLLPCTLDSASRTSTTAPPHPLHDKLFYIARDCGNFVPRKEKKAKKGKKGEEKASPHERYVALLAAWEQSPYADPKIHAVYRYVTEHDVIGELIAKGILYKDAQGRMMEKWEGKQKEKPPIFKAGSKSPLESVVRCRVELDGDPCPELWKDARLQKKYQQFFQQCFSHMKEGLCYATGKQLLVTDKHGRGIRTTGDTTKLISSNDGDGFTFRGRFAEAGECISLGYETSQKALNTLGWLMREQGYSVGSRAFLAWGRVALPSVFDSTEQFVRRRRQKGSPLPLTMRAWAESFAKALKGYRFAFQRAEKSQVNVMVLDAATKGRLAICYYDEMAGEDFLERIEKWHTVGRWWQRDCDETAKKDKSWYPAYYGIPDPKKLIAACRGEKISDKQLDMEIHRAGRAAADRYGAHGLPARHKAGGVRSPAGVGASSSGTCLLHRMQASQSAKGGIHRGIGQGKDGARVPVRQAARRSGPDGTRDVQAGGAGQSHDECDALHEPLCFAAGIDMDGGADEAPAVPREAGKIRRKGKASDRRDPPYVCG